MNTETKLAIAFLALCGIGVGLLVVGLWPSYPAGAVLIGLVLVFGGARLFAAVWNWRD